MIFSFLSFLLLLIFLHRSNINNFINQKEPKITDKSLAKDRIKSKENIEKESKNSDSLSCLFWIDILKDHT